MSGFKGLAFALLICIGNIGSAYAIFGVGVHYTLDFSLKMPDTPETGEQLVFESCTLNTAPAGTFGFFDQNGNPIWSGVDFGPEDMPVFFDRLDLVRTPFGIGGKIYVDIIPLIDVIELNGDMVCWEYSGAVRYPVNIEVPNPPSTPDTTLLAMIDQGAIQIDYDTMDLTLEGNGMRFPGISKTPYIKINTGLTIRKYIPIPVIDNFLRTYGGAGFDVHFSTPIPSAGLLNDAIGAELAGNKSMQELQQVLSDPENSKKVVREIIARLMTPHLGMNIVVGFMLKPPVVPIGLYVDGKIMIPFGPFDKNADVTGVGFKLNTGLCLHIGKRK